MDYLKRKTLIVIGFVVILGAAIYGIYYNKTIDIADSIEKNIDNTDEISTIDETENMSDASTVVEESENTIIFVDIDGAINNPGTFQLPDGTRLCTLIKMAGGLNEDADTKFINRAQKLHDEQKVYIPEEGENIDTILLESKEDADEVNDGLININTASKSNIELLPGIGEVIATRIIEYRENNECFSCIEDIKKVSGIADGKFNQIKDLIKVK